MVDKVFIVETGALRFGTTVEEEEEGKLVFMMFPPSIDA